MSKYRDTYFKKTVRSTSFKTFFWRKVLVSRYHLFLPSHCSITEGCAQEAHREDAGEIETNTPVITASWITNALALWRSFTVGPYMNVVEFIKLMV